jgi:purine-nucleoside phosphorylase
MIAVTFALPSESSSFTRLLGNQLRGNLSGHKVCVLHTGAGEKTTRARIATFLKENKPRLLISSGFAGALNDRFRVGDLLLAENYSAPELVEALRLLENKLHFRAGQLTTVSAVIDSIADREKLSREEGGDAVDMETRFIAEACATAGIPMISLRAISDTPAAPFPAPPHLLFDIARQRTAFAPLFNYLLWRPLTLGRMLIFAKQITTARRSLTQGLEGLVTSELL